MSGRVADAARLATLFCLSALALTSAVACTAAGDDGTRASRSAIVGGADSAAADDAVVLLLRVDPARPDEAERCTGTLLAPNLVVTARHCVADADTQVSCNDDGKADVGGAVRRDAEPTDLHVYAGRERPRPGDEGVRAKEVLTTGATNLCDHDIALVLLDENVRDARIAPVRLGPPASTETVRVVGWGVTSEGTLPATRQVRDGVAVTAVGPSRRLGPKEFRIAQGACAGDSGGPALARSGAVLGVLSRGGSGATSDAGLIGICETGENVYTQVGAHEALLTAGYEAAGAPMWREGEPDPSPPPPSVESGGCTASGTRPPWSSLVVMLGIVVAWRRRRPRA